MRYIPPFTVSAEAINLIAQISAQIERYAIRLEQSDGLRLRRANRIKTIHSSLAIEGNKLTVGQVSDIIDGKNVVAPPRDIQEVKNAIATYDLFAHLDLPRRNHIQICREIIRNLRCKTSEIDGICARQTGVLRRQRFV